MNRPGMMAQNAHRPVTSKSRGQCRYYTTPRGCLNGNKCKFLHGESETLTPYDRAKTCRFFANGNCQRGADCWFRHVLPEAPSSPSSSLGEGAESEDICCICLEKPIIYGLLTGCSHMYCLECIRHWRDPAGKSGDVVVSGNTKKCPLCRSPSRFITPSSRFVPDGHPGKIEIIEGYKASMARVPCRHFVESKSSGARRPHCPFGSDCFYQHINDDGTSHIFPGGVDHQMRLHRTRQRPSTGSRYANQALDVLNRIFADNPMDELSATIEAIRASFPPGRSGASEANTGSAGGENGVDGGDRELRHLDVRLLDRLADRVRVTLALISTPESGTENEGEGDMESVSDDLITVDAESIEGVDEQSAEVSTPHGAQTPRPPPPSTRSAENTELSEAIMAVANISVDITARLSLHMANQEAQDGTVDHEADTDAATEALVEHPVDHEWWHQSTRTHTDNVIHLGEWNDGTSLEPEEEAVHVDSADPRSSPSPSFIPCDVMNPSTDVHWIDTENPLLSSATNEPASTESSTWASWASFSILPDTPANGNGNTISRFSTVVGRSADEERYVINIDDDEEESREAEQLEDEHVEPDERVEEDLAEPRVDNVDNLESSSIEEPVLAIPPNQPSTLPPATEPPFVTDGRGRVVWSSTREGSAGGGRSRNARARAGDKARRSERVVVDIGPEIGAEFTTDGWGRVIGTSGESRGDGQELHDSGEMDETDASPVNDRAQEL